MKRINIKVSFKGRWELFTMKIRLFGFREINFKSIKELLVPQKLECLFG